MNCRLDLLVFQMKGKHITVMISKPPISSPFTYTCGYVGQLEKVFRPWRTWCRVIIDRFRVTFTANGKREFVPGDHVLPTYRLLLFNITTRKSVDSRQFYPWELFRAAHVFTPHFLLWEFLNVNLTFAVYRTRDSKSLLLHGTCIKGRLA